jgi:hypothetical protein
MARTKGAKDKVSRKRRLLLGLGGTAALAGVGALAGSKLGKKFIKIEDPI